MSQKLDDFISKLPAEEQDAIGKAKQDALADIEAELDYEGSVQVACHFGSAVIINDDGRVQKASLVNILIPEAESHAEAVGLAYLHLRRANPPEDGWMVQQLQMEEEIIWADSREFEEWNEDREPQDMG